MPLSRCQRPAFRGLALGAACLAAWCGSALGQNLAPLSPRAVANGAVVSREHGWEFVTIGAPGNAPYEVPFEILLNNPGPLTPTFVGSVNYEYRIARSELRTEQWVEFINLFPNALPLGGVPTDWGAERDFDAPPGVRRYFIPSDIPRAADYQVSGVSMLGAAAYCNWLHNGKPVDASALRSGAYDIGSYFDTGQVPLTISRQAGARFWIPSLDESVKAGYFDPNRSGQGQAGYWLYPNSSDTPPIYGPAQLGGEANAGGLFGGGNPYLPVGSYPTVQSPWGLLDLAGGADFGELTDTRHQLGTPL